ncbi:MAG: F0F1 ATP synthase subunit delta [Clostridium sp.]
MYEFLDRRYALALYEACVEAGNVELVLQQLKEIVNEMDSNKDFLKVIKNPQISKFNKKRIFKELFENSIERELMNFLLLTIDKERILYLREKYEQFKQIYLAANKIITAEVRSAIPLSNEERETLKLVLEKRYNKTVMLKQKIDITLIGGVIIRIGDEIIDGSIKNRLVEFRQISDGIDEATNTSASIKNTRKQSQKNMVEEVLQAKVTTVIPLTEKERIQLITNLEQFYERKIELSESIDKELLGGIVVTIGEDVTDYTIKDKLKHIQNN